MYQIILLLLFGSDLVFGVNDELSQLETNLLHQHLKTMNDLNFFYQQLIRSNDVDDSRLLHTTINENDIRNQNIEHKVI